MNSIPAQEIKRRGILLDIGSHDEVRCFGVYSREALTKTP
ncbi:hypothetical protein JN12_02509 [Geobacter argillaceus]|uniref:Uncharacterized protein n=1 Tax=Geobacter argillaceus TaxID=345631 RepID=A0A562VL89_9BACT|nr:hypothetical protein JN12_02509 [Geobacter argillaceus]